MTSADYYIPSTADYDSYYRDTPDPPLQHPSLNNKIMVLAIVILFCVILFITSLHIFGKWAWRSNNRPNSANRIHFFHPIQVNSLQSHMSSGLSKAAIAQLPTFTYKTPARNDLEDGRENAHSLECAVCLSEFQEDEKGRLLPSCKHSFHIECIDMWFYSHSTCPLCRAVVMPSVTTSPLIPTATNSTHDQHQQGAEELASTGAQNAIEATSTPHESNPLINATAIAESHNATTIIRIPPNILFCGDSLQSIPSHQVGSSQSSEKPLQDSSSSSSRSTRIKAPHITIEIPTRQEINLTSPGCVSVPSRRSRCASPQYEQACSSLKSLKSPGLRESVKRMLSIQSGKERRAFSSSSQEANMESPKGYS